VAVKQLDTNAAGTTVLVNVEMGSKMDPKSTLQQLKTRFENPKEVENMFGPTHDVVGKGEKIELFGLICAWRVL
jgi:hypothetical protein